jgi:hypothetical protein
LERKKPLGKELKAPLLVRFISQLTSLLIESHWLVKNLWRKPRRAIDHLSLPAARVGPRLEVHHVRDLNDPIECWPKYKRRW